MKVEKSLNKKKKLLEVLKEFYQKKKSLLAFNVQNIYHLEAIKLITEEIQIPVIVQFSARYVKHFEKKIGFKVLNEKYKNNYMYFHLDHCQDLELIEFCLKQEFDGVMYDGSEHSLEHNIKISKKVKELASKFKTLVEGELGEIGGVEDGEGTESLSYANLDHVKKYVEETGIDLLALGIGNIHGYYTTLKNIDVSILLKAKNLLNNQQLFVLHGGSGLPEDLIKETIRYGVVKINFSTQLKDLTNQAIQEFLNHNQLFDEISFENLLVKKLSENFKILITTFSK